MAIDYYLSIDKPFDSRDKIGSSTEQQISSYSFGVSTTGTASATGASAGKTTFSNINISLSDSDISDTILQSELTGKSHTYYISAIQSGASGTKPVEQIVLTGGTVTSFQESASSDVPTDSVSLAFKTFKKIRSKVSAAGTVTDQPPVTYDLTTNKVAAARVQTPPATLSSALSANIDNGQDSSSAFDNVFQNAGAPDTTFTFTSGHGNDLVDQFRAGGADHDKLSFLGSDFGNDIANVLRHTHNVTGGVLITDPTSKDTVMLAGVNKNQLIHNQGDIVFHS